MSDDADAPYPSVLGATRDGWHVIQLRVLQGVEPRAIQQLSYVRLETREAHEGAARGGRRFRLACGRRPIYAESTLATYG